MHIPISALAIVEVTLNKALATGAVSKASLLTLNGKVIQVSITGLEISITIIFVDGEVQLSSLYDGKPDLKVRGAPSDFFRLLQNTDVVFASGLEFQGDTNVAQDLKSFFANTQLDIEELVAPLFGGTVAHQFGRLHKKLKVDFFRKVESIEQDLSDFLVTETNTIVSSKDLDRFFEEVDCIRDDVDRLETRIDFIKSRDSGKK